MIQQAPGQPPVISLRSSRILNLASMEVLVVRISHGGKLANVGYHPAVEPDFNRSPIPVRTLTRRLLLPGSLGRRQVILRVRNSMTTGTWIETGSLQLPGSIMPRRCWPTARCSSLGF